MRQKTKQRRRGTRLPLPNIADPLYYTAIDYGAPGSPERAYIDPWDLENYDYVRKQLSLSDNASSSTPSPAGEPIPSKFLFLRNNSEECPACCAGLDEQTFYNARYESILDEDRAYSTYTDLESSSSTERYSSCGDSSISRLVLHTPGFGAASGRRRLVLPKPAPQLEFPAPPPYDYCCPIPENSYCTVSDCYECLSENIPLYVPTSSIYSGGRSLYHTKRFGLSKKGLLQIDYSCNWDNLDRLIANDY